MAYTGLEALGCILLPGDNPSIAPLLCRADCAVLPGQEPGSGSLEGRSPPVRAACSHSNGTGWHGVRTEQQAGGQVGRHSQEDNMINELLPILKAVGEGLGHQGGCSNNIPPGQTLPDVGSHGVGQGFVAVHELHSHQASAAEV